MADKAVYQPDLLAETVLKDFEQKINKDVNTGGEKDFRKVMQSQKTF